MTSVTKYKGENFLRLSQVLGRFPVSRSHWWAGVRTGKYPKPYQLSANITAWAESDIDALIEGIIGDNHD